MESLVLDTLDRQLVHALQVDGRVSFGLVAAVLGASDRTVARRYHRLRAAGAVRVVGVGDARALGQEDWLVRAHADPVTATALAATLARRDDTSWVGLGSGGTEVTCVVRADRRTRHGSLVLQKLPRTPRITDLTAQCLLRQVAGSAGWQGRTSALSAAQIDALGDDGLTGPADGELDDADRALLAVLGRDGRATHPVLAAASRCSESTVGRRLAHLRRAGVLHFEVEVDPHLFGAGCEAVLWLTVAPGAVAAVGRELAGHDQVAFAAATSGATNLVAFAICRDVDALYDYLVERLGPVAGVERVDTAPIAHHVKRAGTLVMPEGAAG